MKVKGYSRYLVRSPRITHAQLGLTLVELMVALTIGLIVLAAIGQLFVTSRATYTMQDGIARTQEAGRFAMEFLAQDIRMAGYMGCVNPTQAGAVYDQGAITECTHNGQPTSGTGQPVSFCNLVTPADESTRAAAEGIRGYTYTGNGSGNALTDWSPALPASFFSNGEVRPGTDVILIQYGRSTGTRLTGNTTPSNANVQIRGDSPLARDGVAQNEILMISDCKGADVFRVTNNPNFSTPATPSPVTLAHGVSQGGAGGNLSNKLSHAYADDAEVMKLVSRVYFISNPAVATSEPGLMRKELGSGGVVGTAQELVQGIEDMRFMYGVDTDPAPVPPAADPDPFDIANRYVLPTEVVDLTGPGTTTWDNVVSVRVGLLIRTPGNVDQGLDARTYELVDGVTVDPTDDNRRRQVYRSTIQLRN